MSCVWPRLSKYQNTLTSILRCWPLGLGPITGSSGPGIGILWHSRVRVRTVWLKVCDELAKFILTIFLLLLLTLDHKVLVENEENTKKKKKQPRQPYRIDLSVLPDVELFRKSRVSATIFWMQSALKRVHSPDNDNHVKGHPWQEKFFSDYPTRRPAWRPFHAFSTVLEAQVEGEGHLDLADIDFCWPNCVHCYYCQPW